MGIVHSRDGTPLSYGRVGTGKALVLICGALSDRKSMSGLAVALGEHFCVTSYDRRGRGESGDTPPYAPEREMEDLHAIIEHVGGEAYVYGHSSGAMLALEAAGRGLALTRLAVYEPPYILEGTRAPLDPELGSNLARLVASGQEQAAVGLFLEQGVAMSLSDIEAVRSSPHWNEMVRLATSLPYDVALCRNDSAVPYEHLVGIAIPLLAIEGALSPSWAKAAVREVVTTVPGAAHFSLPGAGHTPSARTLAPHLLSFFG